MLGLAIMFGIIGGIWCAVVAGNKNISVGGYALLGVLFPLIGVILVHVAAPAPAAPAEPGS